MSSSVQLQPGMQVAANLVSTALAMDGVAMARFSQEAATAAQMKHPHVVQVFDHGVTSHGIPYIAMELLEGEDLGTRLARLGRLDPQETSIILSQTCKALSRAHGLGLVHRDIKPDNIFLTDLDGEVFVKVLDFGIAKQTQPGTKNMTSTGAVIGTPYYMSPEQATSSKHVDPQADLWSLAVVAYHCLTGSVPFNGEMLGALFIAIDRAQFVPPTQRVPSLPPTLDAWFRQALARDPAQRFSSAKDFASTFEQAIQGRFVPTGMRAVEGYGPSAQASTMGQAMQAATLGGATVTSANKRKRARVALVVGINLLLGTAAAAAGFGAWRMVVAPSDQPDAGLIAAASDVPAEPPQPSSAPPAVEPIASAPASATTEPKADVVPPAVTTAKASSKKTPGTAEAKTPAPTSTAAPPASTRKRNYGF